MSGSSCSASFQHMELINPLISLIRCQFLYEDAIGDGIKNLTKVKVDKTHCSPLVHQASHLSTEGSQVG